MTRKRVHWRKRPACVSKNSGTSRERKLIKTEVKIKAWEAIRGGNKSIGDVVRDMDVDRSVVKRWRKQLNKAKSKLGAKGLMERKECYSLHNGATPKCVDIDGDLMEYFTSEREMGNPMTKNLMVIKYRTLDPTTIDVTDKAMGERIRRWMFRHRISYRCSTHVGQNTRFCAQVINDWVAYVRDQISMLGIPPENVVNVDETNANFAVSQPRTYHMQGEKTVSIRTSESSKRASVMLGVSMTGEFLAPFIIFAGKDDARNGQVFRELQQPAQNGYPEGMFYAVQEKAWMNEAKMLEWVEKVWRPFTETKTGMTYLIMDEFSAHKTAAVLAAIRACGTEIEFVPRGYTSQLQVMDVGLNKPFKDKYRKEHNLFLTTNVVGEKVKRQHVAHWVLNAWRSINRETSDNTWRRVFQLNRGNEIEQMQNEMVVDEDNDIFLDYDPNEAVNVTIANVEVHENN